MTANQTSSPLDQATSASDKKESLVAAPTTVTSEPPATEGSFVLILKNGTRHSVSDYWVADGYIEYLSQDGTRSHCPIETLDIEKTALENSRRGLTFAVRSAPANTQ